MTYISTIIMGMSTIIRAQSYIDKHFADLKSRCDEISKVKTPKMRVILVGQNPASTIYVGYKKKLCEKIGAQCEIIEAPADIKKEEFLKVIRLANADSEVNGIIIQLPVPEQLKELDLYSLVNPFKDIDGFHPLNIKNIFENNVSQKSLLPCTPKGVMKLIDEHSINLEGKDALVIGRSHIVGKPLSLLLLNRNATVTMCHSYSQNLKNLCKQSDIIISAVGKAKFINSEYLSKSKEQVLIDVGISHDDEGKICGDMDFDDIVKFGVKAITPVPGGVGPMTVYSLIENLIIATELQVK